MPHTLSCAWKADDASEACFSISELAAGDVLAAPGAPGPLWRLKSGALRLDRLDPVDPAGGLFMQLVLPGDLVGLEGLAGEAAAYRVRAIVPSRVQRLPAGSVAERLHWMAEGLLQQQRRGEDLVLLRSGSAQDRFKQLLLLLAPEAAASADDVSAWDLPTLKDMAAIIDTAPETVSRILSSLRRTRLLDGRQRQTACFSPARLREVTWPTGMTRTDRETLRQRASGGLPTAAWAA
ncbi:Crp/Fnr family transcriptional regulator [Ideonella sp. B7]|uniref:Crp/Fnr family transcriptional regulator n=1 Tax=Ideonella benzenivorans TaxID=2831643 RepID=UPI001CED0F68|nr:Crp/Fnr family transcriptional regulator [Ideonella benzenivorans]MCA6215321.1 Crp/Fnr family transcriptional regulator [Ideonella benzenivorans]